jgi:hypothetical protein
LGVRSMVYLLGTLWTRVRPIGTHQTRQSTGDARAGVSSLRSCVTRAAVLNVPVTRERDGRGRSAHVHDNRDRVCRSVGSPAFHKRGRPVCACAGVTE